jgi:uncharacterized membrane protein
VDTTRHQRRSAEVAASSLVTSVFVVFRMAEPLPWPALLVSYCSTFASAEPSRSKSSRQKTEW